MIYGEFTSLLQLGVGTGIGLSLFRAPVALRVAGISRTLDSEIDALRGSRGEFARQKRRDLMELRLRFVRTRADLDKVQLPFMVAAVIGAALNLGFLIKATFDAHAVVGSTMSVVLLLVSIGYFVLLFLALLALAHWYLNRIQKDLGAIQMRRAPPVDIPAAAGQLESL